MGKFKTSTATLQDTLAYLLNRHQSLNHLNQIHSLLITSGLSHPHLPDLTFLFDEFSKPTTHLCNTIITHFSTTSSSLSLAFYARIHQKGFVPDKHTFPLLLKAFSNSRNHNPFQFYTHVIKYGFDSDGFVRNSLVSAFSNTGFVTLARQLFDQSPHRDVVAWTAMIDGYVKNGSAVEALTCFKEMRLNGVGVDAVTVVSVLVAAGISGDVWFGKWVHGFYIVRNRVPFDVYVGSALIDMYSKCGCCDDACRAFQDMPSRNVVCWTALIVGYVQCDLFNSALDVFKDMIIQGIKPNQLTLSSVLTACARIGALDQGRWIHGYITRYKLDVSLTLGTALIDMYSKCGCIEEALMVFENLHEKDVYPFTAMINGLAMNGDVSGSLDVFSSMLRSGVQPNKITFLGVLSACAHGGLVNEGFKLFKSMKDNHNLEPSVDHYGCMVDLLGRAGCLEEARKLIEDMPMEPSPGVWAALLTACMIHNAFELGEYVGNRLIRLQPSHSGNYAQLANLYSKSRRWDGSARVRQMMKRIGVEKIPGCSWIQINGVISEFISHGTSHSESAIQMYKMLNNINLIMKLNVHALDADLLLALDLDCG